MTVWCMLLTDSAAIRDVLLFPTMKTIWADPRSPQGRDSEDSCQAARTAAKSCEDIREKIDFSKVKIEPLFEEHGGF